MNGSTVLRHNAMGNRQPETSPFLPRRKEGAEDPGHIRVRNPQSLVNNVDDGLMPVGRLEHAYTRTAGTRLNGIAGSLCLVDDAMDMILARLLG